jgi:hypothetical protein
VACIDWSKTRVTDHRKRSSRRGREGLHHPHAGDVLFHVRGELGHPLLDLLQRRARAAPVAGRDQHDERYGRQREGAEPGLEGEHRARGEQDRERALGDEDEPVAEEEAHGLQVHRRPRHQLAGLRRGEEAELQRLQVGVHEVAQVDLDAQRDAARDEPARDRQRDAQDRDADDGGHQRGQPGLVVSGDAVDRAARQPRDRDRAGHRETGEHQRRDRSSRIRLEEREQTEERVHVQQR